MSAKTPAPPPSEKKPLAPKWLTSKRLMHALFSAFGLFTLGFLFFWATSRPPSEVVRQPVVESKTAVTFKTQVPSMQLPSTQGSTSVPTPQASTSKGFGGLGAFKGGAATAAPEDPDALQTLYAAGEIEAPPVRVAPYGRLLCCETVLTLDASNTLTPVVGLVTQDLWYEGVCLIPAGTEVHGSAQAVQRDRLMTDSDWTLVWVTRDSKNGQQLRLKALALDHEADVVADTWSLLDGAAGIRGTLLKSDELAELKLFGATFLGGVIEAIEAPEKAQLVQDLESKEDQPTKVKTSLKTAMAQGTTAVLERYAERVMDTLDKELFFLRIPAGKQFYLYIQQPIDWAHLELMHNQ